MIQYVEEARDAVLTAYNRAHRALTECERIRGPRGATAKLLLAVSDLARAKQFLHEALAVLRDSGRAAAPAAPAAPTPNTQDGHAQKD